MPYQCICACPISAHLTPFRIPFPYPYTLSKSVFLAHIRTPYPTPYFFPVSVHLTQFRIPHPYPYTLPDSVCLAYIRTPHIQIPCPHPYDSDGLGSKGALFVMLCILPEWICVHDIHAHYALCVCRGYIGGWGAGMCVSSECTVQIIFTILMVIYVRVM